MIGGTIVQVKKEGRDAGILVLYWSPAESRRLWLHYAFLQGVSMLSLTHTLVENFGCASIAWRSKRKGWSRVVRRLCKNGFLSPGTSYPVSDGSRVFELNINTEARQR